MVNMIFETNIIDELGNSQITGVVLFLIGLLIFYLFMRFFIRVYLHTRNNE